MRRRKFITLLSGAAAALPLRSAAKLAGGMWRIGYLSNAYGPNDNSESFVRGLRELGYIEGMSFIVTYRFAAGKNDRLSELAAELIHANVDLIVTEGTPPTQAAIQATKLIPIVFGNLQDPVEKGIVASLAHPGGNVTGIALIAFHSKSLELLKEAVPGTTQVVFLYDPATRPGGWEATLTALQGDARRVGLTLQPVSLRDPDEADQAFTTFAAGTNGLLVQNSAINGLAQERICQLAMQHGLPAVGVFRGIAVSGCLMSYGENLPELSRQAATYVDKIFKGAKPSDLPVMQATTFDLVINLKTAKALGLTVPASLLTRATAVIE
jgi:putative ABC transport system substrate-binding protein